MTEPRLTDACLTDRATPVVETSGPVIITRELDVEVSTDELWNMIADGDRWAEWLTEQSDVVVEPQRSGVVVDDEGTERHVTIQSVVAGERVRFAWWPTDRPDESSMVELVVSPSPDDGHSRLSVIEIYASTGSSVAARHSAAETAAAWDLRLMLLVLCLDAVALVRR